MQSTPLDKIFTGSYKCYLLLGNPALVLDPGAPLTFLLPADLQIGLAALWSLVLGLIMGLTRPKPNENEELTD